MRQKITPMLTVEQDFLGSTLKSSEKLSQFLAKHHRVIEHIVLVVVYPRYFFDLARVYKETSIVRLNVRSLRTSLQPHKKNYLLLREVYDSLNQVHERNAAMLNTDVKGYAMWRRVLYRPVINMCRVMELLRSNVETLLKEMEQTPFQQGEEFVKISEADLWEMRCKQYAPLI